MILRHTLGYTLVKFFPAIASLVTLMLFTRLMSPAQFGEYSLTVNVTTTMVAILGNFLVIGLGRFEPAAVTVAEKSKLHSTVIVTSIAVSVAVAVLIGLLKIFNLLPALSVDYSFLATLFFITLFMQLSQQLINANLKPKAYGVSLAIRNILLLAAGSACLIAGYEVFGVLASLAVATLLAALPAIGLWGRATWRGFDFSELKKLWAYGAPLTLLYLFVMIIGFSDRIFIDVMLGSDAVGLYSAGYDLTQYSIAIVASIVHLAAFPIILKAFESEGQVKAKELMSTSLRMLLLVMLPVSMGFIAIKEEISSVFMGSGFSETAVMIIPILALSVLVSSVKSYYFDYAFQITKTTWLQTIPPMLAALVNCIFNYYLIPAMGVLGAAYATLIAYCFYLFLTVFLAVKIFQFSRFPWGYLIKLTLASLLMLFVVKWVEPDVGLLLLLVLKVLVGVLVFCCLLLAFMKHELILLFKDANAFKGDRDAL